MNKHEELVSALESVGIKLTESDNEEGILVRSDHLMDLVTAMDDGVPAIDSLLKLMRFTARYGLPVPEGMDAREVPTKLLDEAVQYLQGTSNTAVNLTGTLLTMKVSLAKIKAGLELHDAAGEVPEFDLWIEQLGMIVEIIELLQLEGFFELMGYNPERYMQDISLQDVYDEEVLKDAKFKSDQST